MPLVHSRTFRIRYYECDAYEHLNNANYLRFMQEAAFDASAAAGFPRQRYVEMGTSWLIHNTEIEYLVPARFDDRIEVRTWVADFRKVTSRRAYEFYQQGTDTLVARAFTDWAYIDNTTGRPVLIPQELCGAFFPEGLPESFPPRQRSVEALPPPSGVFKTRRRVTWRDIDAVQHVNNAVYLEFIDECGFQVVAAHGWPVQRMLAQSIAILIRRHQIEYVQPARLGDELEISTWVSNVRAASALRHYTITRVEDGALIARVNSLGALVDLHSGKPVRFPEEFLQAFEPNISKGA